jgi:hypothetical protein
MSSGGEKGSTTTKTPADFLKSIRGRPVVVKLNSGVDYRGLSFSLCLIYNPCSLCITSSVKSFFFLSLMPFSAGFIYLSYNMDAMVDFYLKYSYLPSCFPSKWFFFLS